MSDRSAEEPIDLFASVLFEYAVITLDANGFITSWNQGAEHLVGRTAHEVVGQHVSLLYTADQVADGLPERLLARAAELGSYIDEGWRRRKDGSWAWAHVLTTALRSPTGVLRGFVRLVRDDTKAHARLERSLRQFKDLLSLTPVGIGLFDRYGNVLESNKALCELLGYPEGKMVGVNVRDLVHPEAADEAGLHSPSGPAAPFNEDHVQEWSLVGADGRSVYCELHVTHSLLEDGSPFWLVVFEDITERHRRVEELRHKAMHDELTGLPNRAAINELLAQADPDGLAVFYCDIHNFTRINDALGHTAGDELLVKIARRLEAQLPEGWMVTRPAGDEYLVICPDVVAAGGIEAAAAMVSRLFRTSVPLRGQLVHISVSVGAAMPRDGIGVEDLLRFADAAALRAKSNAPERILLTDPALVESVNRQIVLEGQLRSAIEEDALTLLYQPIVREDGTVATAEALLRWDHPELGTLPPGMLIPVAAQGDLMRDVDRWVLRTALREAARWPALPSGAPVSVAVNLCELVPGTADFTSTVIEALAETGIDPNRVVLELLETSLFELPARTQAAMKELTARGIRFAVDDFGIGFSSLSRLRDLPIQSIKIDRSFVTGMTTDPWKHALVKAIASLAQALDCHCTAEGVETSEQFAALRSLPVSEFQGWLFSRAVPAEELSRAIENGPLRPAGHT